MLEAQLQAYLQREGYSRLNLKGVLFDMDGVLFNSMPYHTIAWHKAMKEHGLDMPQEEAYLHEGRTGEGTINIVMQREWGREATPEEVEAIYRDKSKEFNKFPPAPAMPGSPELVRKICEQGLIASIVTGSGQKSLLSRIEEFYPSLFNPQQMVTAFDVTHGKPHPEPYLKGLKKTGLQAHEAIVVENAPMGVEAGCTAGIFTVAVNTGPMPDEVLWEAGADMLFHSIEEFSAQWDAFHRTLKNTEVPHPIIS